MDSDFVIPLNKEDLLSNRAADGYGVRKIYEPSQLGEKLEGNNNIVQFHSYCSLYFLFFFKHVFPFAAKTIILIITHRL